MRQDSWGCRRRLRADPPDRIEVLEIHAAMVDLSAHDVRHGLATGSLAEARILVDGRGERSRKVAFRDKAVGHCAAPVTSMGHGG